jgi:hypothetical protein
MKITIQSKVVKKEGQSNGKPWIIHEYTCLADGETKKMDSFATCEIGKEYEVEVTPNANPEYNAQFKLKKTGGFKGKNYDFEKRRVAHETTVQMIVSGKVQMENLIECRDKFFEYLNG